MSTPRPGQHAESDRMDRQREMREYNVHYDGCSYEYNGYHYDCLHDALAYARLMRSRPQQPDPRGPYRPCRDPGVESETDKRHMAALGIELKDGRYCYRGFRYDRLVEAVDYALLEQRRGDTTQHATTP
ncbi:hypothetical protein [Tahibacter amnicola]|uniref:Uncharacterized protein n=1 Tax=Tahibacter amnicola TaxID=2976241 RepID=A0ABY6BCI8_9GAMM|nr:hypothetical protein [Tahibacter amnicola]UXI66040.1 hypothetical protein N4264_14905 [Tahibacter amnicola]